MAGEALLLGLPEPVLGFEDFAAARGDALGGARAAVGDRIVEIRSPLPDVARQVQVSVGTCALRMRAGSVGGGALGAGFATVTGQLGCWFGVAPREGAAVVAARGALPFRFGR